ncbi:MAG: hypothetical protein Q7J27_09815 [Syntrophales bacterium]|nr:hypothetical protein [Syntrophales bacterium]
MVYNVVEKGVNLLVSLPPKTSQNSGEANGNLEKELGGRGITIVTLRPGYVDAGRAKKCLQTRKEEVLTFLSFILTCL